MHVNGAADGPNGLLELIEARLREIPPENYVLTRHLEIKCGQRGIPIKSIVENLARDLFSSYGYLEIRTICPNRIIWSLSRVRRSTRT